MIHQWLLSASSLLFYLISNFSFSFDSGSSWCFWELKMLQHLSTDISSSPIKMLHSFVLQHFTHPIPGTRRVILHFSLWPRNCILKKKSLENTEWFMAREKSPNWGNKGTTYSQKLENHTRVNMTISYDYL